LCADYTITELPSEGDDIYNCYKYTACDYDQNRYKKVKNITEGWGLYDDDTCQEIMQCIDIEDTVTLYDSEDVCRNNNKDGCHTRSYGRKVDKNGYIESYDCYTPDTCEYQGYSSSDCESQDMEQDGKPVTINDNTCYKCKAKKNCSEIDSNYYNETACDEQAKADSSKKCKQVDGISGSDGDCYKLVAKTCSEINSNYYNETACTETSTQKCEQVTDTSGSDGDCYKLVAKTCNEINSNYSSDSKNCGATGGQSCIATDKKDGNGKTCYVAGCDESVYTYNTTSDNDTHCYDVSTCSVDNKTYYKKVEKSPKDAGYDIDNNTCKYMCSGYTLTKPDEGDDIYNCYTYTACDYDTNLYKRVEKSPKDEGYEISGDKCVKKTSGSGDGTQCATGYSTPQDTNKANAVWKATGYKEVKRYTEATETSSGNTCYKYTENSVTCSTWGLYTDKTTCQTQNSGYSCDETVTFTASDNSSKTISCYAKGSKTINCNTTCADIGDGWFSKDSTKYASLCEGHTTRCTEKTENSCSCAYKNVCVLATFMPVGDVYTDDNGEAGTVDITQVFANKDDAEKSVSLGSEKNTQIEICFMENEIEEIDSDDEENRKSILKEGTSSVVEFDFKFAHNDEMTEYNYLMGNSVKMIRLANFNGTIQYGTVYNEDSIDVAGLGDDKNIEYKAIYTKSSADSDSVDCDNIEREHKCIFYIADCKKSSSTDVNVEFHSGTPTNLKQDSDYLTSQDDWYYSKTEYCLNTKRYLRNGCSSSEGGLTELTLMTENAEAGSYYKEAYNTAYKKYKKLFDNNHDIEGYYVCGELPKDGTLYISTKDYTLKVPGILNGMSTTTAFEPQNMSNDAYASERYQFKGSSSIKNNGIGYAGYDSVDQNAVSYGGYKFIKYDTKPEQDKSSFSSGDGAVTYTVGDYVMSDRIFEFYNDDTVYAEDYNTYINSDTFIMQPEDVSVLSSGAVFASCNCDGVSCDNSIVSKYKCDSTDDAGNDITIRNFIIRDTAYPYATAMVSKTVAATCSSQSICNSRSEVISAICNVELSRPLYKWNTSKASYPCPMSYQVCDSGSWNQDTYEASCDPAVVKDMSAQFTRGLMATTTYYVGEDSRETSFVKNAYGTGLKNTVRYYEGGIRDGYIMREVVSNAENNSSTCREITGATEICPDSLKFAFSFDVDTLNSLIYGNDNNDEYAVNGIVVDTMSDGVNQSDLSTTNMYCYSVDNDGNIIGGINTGVRVGQNDYEYTTTVSDAATEKAATDYYGTVPADDYDYDDGSTVMSTCVVVAQRKK
jgi:hypothetical protein